MTRSEKQYYKEIGQTFKALRKAHKLRQVPLAKKLGVEQSAVCRIEKGEQRLSLYQASIFAEICGTRLYYFDKDFNDSHVVVFNKIEPKEKLR